MTTTEKRIAKAFKFGLSIDDCADIWDMSYQTIEVILRRTLKKQSGKEEKSEAK